MHKSSNINLTIKAIIFTIAFISSVVVLVQMYSNILSDSKSTSYILIFLLIAICVNYGLSILKHFINFSQKRWVFLSLKWTLTIIIPIVLILLIEHSLQKRAMSKIAQRLTPVITYIENHKKLKNTFPKSIDNNIVTKIKYTYHHGKDAYIVKTVLHIFDKMGETIYYDFKDKKWYRFHQDQYEYFKDKKVMPLNIKNYLSLIKESN